MEYTVSLSLLKAQALVQFRGQRHRSRSQLRSRAAHRVRTLARMPALYALAAPLAPAYMNMKLDPLDLGLRYLGLILLIDLGLFQLPAAMRATIRQLGFQRLVNHTGNRPATAASVAASRFPAGPGRMSFGRAPRKRRRLALGCALRFFQSM